MVQIVVAWLILAKVATSIHATVQTMEVLQLRVKASFPLNIQAVIYVLNYKVMPSLMQKKGGLHYVNGAGNGKCPFDK